MAIKTETVMARVEPQIKEKAEEILSALGVSSSGIINMLYRQIILTGGIPFSVTLPHALRSEQDMSAAELGQVLGIGLRQAKDGQGVSLDEAFQMLEGML